MKKGYLKITKKRKGQDEDIHDVKRSAKSAKVKKGLPAISSWDIMILRQRENFEEKSGGIGRCPIGDDVILEPELAEVKCEDLVKKFNNLKERKNELRLLILKGLEDKPQDNNLLSLLIEFDSEFGPQRRHDDEEVETP
ncbi:hypothetical protein L2E82_17955 [Cichorium intybus]|uniref:Uncharacterized protein n=1 Tax=Cichorium intybus TaxID=13427 RepID=A0ACB9F9K3_CICIN|nr:hypothetical protein L2E82_17955 [Cichorium intybus]